MTVRSLTLAATLLALSGCEKTSQTTRGEARAPVAPLPTTRVEPRDDAEDRDRALSRRVRAAIVRRPALQLLPWRAPGIVIDLDGVNSDGRVVLLVRTDLDHLAARRAYRNFLRRADDDERAYLPAYRSTR